MLWSLTFRFPTRTKFKQLNQPSFAVFHAKGPNKSTIAPPKRAYTKISCFLAGKHRPGMWKTFVFAVRSTVIKETKIQEKKRPHQFLSREASATQKDYNRINEIHHTGLQIIHFDEKHVVPQHCNGGWGDVFACFTRSRENFEVFISCASVSSPTVYFLKLISGCKNKAKFRTDERGANCMLLNCWY